GAVAYRCNWNAPSWERRPHSGPRQTVDPPGPVRLFHSMEEGRMDEFRYVCPEHGVVERHPRSDMKPAAETCPMDGSDGQPCGLLLRFQLPAGSGPDEVS